VISDIGRQRIDINHIELLPNVLGKEMVRDAGACEVWLVVRIDGERVENGTPDRLRRRLRDCYLAHAAAMEGKP
jgi:hypothetical protein